MSQIVAHKSRTEKITFNYPASEGNLSWTFIPDSTGEIFLAENTNISSYTINAVAPTLPFVISKGVSYVVTIVKQTNGLAASVVLSTRRALDNPITVNIPDLGAYDGRYLYVLKLNNTVEKHDVGLLTPANYAGAGTWTLPTLVSTINLPTLPNSATYQTISFVKTGGVPRMILVGAQTAAYRIYSNAIRLSDDTVWNLTTTTQDSWTVIVESALLYNNTPTRFSLYNYINEELLFHLTSGGNGAAGAIIDLVTGALKSLIPYATDLSNTIFATSGTAIKNVRGFNPNANLYVGAMTVFDNTGRRFTHLFRNPPLSGIAYNRNLNTVIITAFNVINQIQELNMNGTAAAYYVASNGTGSGQNGVIGYDSVLNEVIFYATASALPNFGWYKKNLSSGTRFLMQNMASGSTVWACMMKSYYNNTWFFTGNASLGLRRVHVMKTSEVVPDFGYFDVDSDIRDMATTQIYD